jgi:hypothetical protein
MKRGLPSLIELAVLGYCLWQASDLPASWLHAPAARYAWIAFLIWIMPVVWHLVECVTSNEDKGYQPIFLGLAVVITLAGTLGSLNALKHVGLAFAIAGMLPFRLENLLWLVTAVAWLPASGYALKALPFSLIPVVQITVATIGSAFLILRNRRKSSNAL